MASIKDVAKKAGVSVNTVSRVLNKRGYLSQKTIEAVNTAIDELNYIPNQIARNLFKQKTNIIGVIIPDVSHPFFAKMVKEIDEALHEKNYKMLLYNTTDSSDKELESLRMLQENKVDGIIIGSHSLNIDVYNNINLPIVALDKYLTQTIPIVSANHIQGGELVANHLLQYNCQKVLQVIGYSKVKTPSNERHYTFEKIMKDHNVECINYELEWNQFDFKDYIKVSNEILDVYPDIDGIFAVDLVAATIMRTALSRGISIPNDLKVVGYDGTLIADVIYPPLPTVKQPYSEIATTCVDVLDNLINQQQNSKLHYRIDVHLE
ncbi:LacI family DNA-binding transcriptional regulator [Priestia megaterium]|uniref:LacI family DNA-binding transcriptional regulator n=1 Tax=Priestia megaterium TaxID=1404 RepID=UPI00263A4BAC|nr:LacI family DNA-binding transcriptional regulator [Priestia megaterium]MDN4865688.1 LacI family DNA-binding transcriptional regulator [Priestia megaterium]